MSARRIGGIENLIYNNRDSRFPARQCPACHCEARAGRQSMAGGRGNDNKKMKNILFINSESDLTVLTAFFKELTNNNYSLFFLSHQKNGIEDFDNFKKLNLSKLKKYIFFVLLPFLFMYFFFYLAYCKYKKKIHLLVCFDYRERIIFSPLAKIFKINNIWFELPGKNYKKSKKIIKLSRFFSRKTKIAVFSDLTTQELQKIGIKNDKIKKLSPGIKLRSQSHQENIFSKIAETNKANHLKKFFTVGTVANLENKQKIELLFQAIKKCLSVMPHLQLIIVGEGKERKNLAWLAKKIEIDNLVWFVGEQTFLKKWLEDFDIYTIVCENPSLNDINITIEAASCGLPIISPDNIGFDELVFQNKNGIIFEANSNEMLAQEIIKLYKDKMQRKNLGQNGKTMVDNSYTIDKMTKSFLSVIEII